MWEAANDCKYLRPRGVAQAKKIDGQNKGSTIELETINELDVTITNAATATSEEISIELVKLLIAFGTGTTTISGKEQRRA